MLNLNANHTVPVISNKRLGTNLDEIDLPQHKKYKTESIEMRVHKFQQIIAAKLSEFNERNMHSNEMEDDKLPEAMETKFNEMSELTSDLIGMKINKLNRSLPREREFNQILLNQTVTEEIKQLINIDMADECSQDNIEMFIRCLGQTDLSELIDMDNIIDILTLARRYEITPVSNFCEDFFDEVYIPFQGVSPEIENLEVGVNFRQAEVVSSSVIAFGKILENRFKYVDRLKNKLKLLADKFKLADLKVLVSCPNVRVLPNNMLSIKVPSLKGMNTEEKKILKECFSIKNPWYFPQIELFTSNLDELDIYSLNEILDHANVSVTLKIDQNIPNNLNEIIHKIPKIEHVRIVYDCINKEAVILEMIKNNTTLKTLHLTINNYNSANGEFDFYWGSGETVYGYDIDDEENEHGADLSNNEGNEKYFRAVKAGEEEIKDALKFNDNLRAKLSIVPLKTKIIQSDNWIDNDSAYTEKLTCELGSLNPQNFQEYVYVHTNRFDSITSSVDSQSSSEYEDIIVD